MLQLGQFSKIRSHISNGLKFLRTKFFMDFVVFEAPIKISMLKISLIHVQLHTYVQRVAYPQNFYPKNYFSREI